MRLGASRRHLQRRPPDRGAGPLAIAAQEGHREVVEALLAAGASVEAKDRDGRGPQRRDGCDTTLSLLPVLGTSFQESSVYFT